jgi:hypothetical protein
MSTNSVKFKGELASLKVKVAKSGNAYLTGVVILRDENGKFESSLPFISFDAVDEAREAFPVILGEDEAAAAQAPRPRANITGWFKSNKVGDEWKQSFQVSEITLA